MPREGYTNLTIRQEDYSKIKGFFEYYKPLLRNIGIGSVSDLVITGTLEKIEHLRADWVPTVELELGGGVGVFYTDDELKSAKENPKFKTISWPIRLYLALNGKLMCIQHGTDSCIDILLVKANKRAMAEINKVIQIETSDRDSKSTAEGGASTTKPVQLKLPLKRKQASKSV